MNPMSLMTLMNTTRPAIAVAIAALGFASTALAAEPGETVYKEVCAACHAAGVANAPKLGDAKRWAPLIREGQVVLTSHGYVGVRAMPARGGKADLSLADFAGATAYMARAAGGTWQDPTPAVLAKMQAEVVRREQKLKATKP